MFLAYNLNTKSPVNERAATAGRSRERKDSRSFKELVVLVNSPTSRVPLGLMVVSPLGPCSDFRNRSNWNGRGLGRLR